MLKDYFQITFREIKRRKLRSWLTLIGIMIGLAAIISLITLGQGLENAINKQFQALGKDKLFIMPKGGMWGMGASHLLSEDDLDVIRKSSGVKSATGLGYSYARLEFNGFVHYAFVNGISPEPEERALIGETQTWKIKEGRMLAPGDNYKVVLGYEHTQKDLFEKRVELGDKLKIHNQPFQVVGFLEKIGSPPDDQSAIIPLETHEEIFDTQDELGFIIAQTKPGEEPSSVAEKVKKDLRKDHGLAEGEEDFSIETPEQFAATFSTILDIVQIVLLGIAAISLLVGGIGIMNTMYTSVLQRTKEIGIMKALGARNSQLLLLFLIESGLYGLGGGIIGIILGISFAKIVEYFFILFVGPNFLSIEINWLLVIGTLIFSFLLGCLSGLAPAYQASRLNPADALRYE